MQLEPSPYNLLTLKLPVQLHRLMFSVEQKHPHLTVLSTFDDKPDYNFDRNKLQVLFSLPQVEWLWALKPKVLGSNFPLDFI